MIHDIIDSGIDEEQKFPLSRRKSISFLLGAGFSAPMGYPISNDMNNGLLNFDDSNLDFSPDGNLTFSEDGTKPLFQIECVLNIHQKYFIFCKRLIKEYALAHGNKFDYEEFYDFIKTDEAKQDRYQALCYDLITDYESFSQYLTNTSYIYNQMAAHLLKDRNGKSWYDDEPFKVKYFDGYNGFLEYLSRLSKEYIINVHTLNHDLLFESFNRTGFINGGISDGFDEFGSEYYGTLSHNNRTYHCRLERYTGRYNTSIRLFKLHGSLDYVPFYRISDDGIMIPDNYVKIKYGIGTSNLMKEKQSEFGYALSPFEYHADFLTGTTSKIQRYDEPLLFKKLFELFKNNLRDAETLIIIGYGCKDVGINELIKEYFDYQNKQIFIVDAFAKEGSQVIKFKESFNARLLRVKIDEIESAHFE